MNTLLLVDGSSYLYRAFHALPDLRSTRGLPTGAIYGVLNMLRRLHKDYPSALSACIFDAKGKTFRDDIYPQYKANRPPMPEDLVAQIAPLHEAIKAMGWPLLIIEGVEADDVIGTLARMAEARDMQVMISTGDKDITQLVTEKITLINTMTNERLDQAGVALKFGVKPDRIVDYLSLIGDSVDNVPGVSKVGPKTAVKWLTQYESVDNLVVHAAEVSGVVGQNLRQALEWLPTARELLRIKCDVPLPITLEDLAPQAQDLTTLARLYEDLDFKTWRRELGVALSVTASESPGSAPPISEPLGSEEAGLPSPPAYVFNADRQYEIVLNEERLQYWIQTLRSASLTAVDTETTGLNPMSASLVGICFAVTPGQAAYIPLAHDYPGVAEQLPMQRVLDLLKPWLEDPQAAKVGQHIKYDTHVLANHGIQLQGVVHDTLLQSYVLESHKPHGMDDLAQRHLNMTPITYDSLTGKGASRIGFEQVCIDTAGPYAAEDADVTLQLHKALYPQIQSQPLLQRVYEEMEMPVMSVLQQMERHGVLLDVVLLAQLSSEFGIKMLQAQEHAYAEAGQPFNLNSPKQIQEILFEKKGLKPVKKTPSGQPSTDEESLEQLALDHPLPQFILQFRGLTKLKSTYCDKLPTMINPATGRVHTHYGQAIAVTGRLSSNEPNLQNIPIRTPEGRRIREAFIAPKGHVIMSADYSQIELRIMAHISQDANLLRAFAAGEDIHRATAAEIFSLEPREVSSEQRRYAKVINFGLIYGMSAFGLAKQLGLERSAAQQYMDRYFARYPGVDTYMKQTRETARQRGYVETVFGRRLWLPEIKNLNPARRQASERAAINAPMQGTAADLIKLAMIAVHGWLKAEKLASRLVMQVHDELILEVPEAEIDRVKTELAPLMNNVASLSVPLAVEIGMGPNWDQAH